MSGVTPILVLLFATVAVAQSPPAQTGPKRLGRPMLTPGAGTAPAGSTPPAENPPPATTPGAAVTPPASGAAAAPKRLGRPVLVRPGPATAPTQPQRR